MKFEPCSKCGGTGKQIDQRAFGEAKRKARLRAGWSLRTVAKRMHFTAPFISDLERGRRNWLPHHITAYDEALK